MLLLAAATPTLGSPRTVLLESFGSVDCQACPSIRNAIATLETEYDLELVAVEYHVTGPLVVDGSLARHAYYGDPAEGTSWFDGVDPHPGPPPVLQDYRERIDAHLASEPPVALEADALFSESARAGSLSVTIEVDADGTVPDPGAYRLRALFLENEVIPCCGPGGTETFDRVVRVVLPERPLTVGASGEIQFERWDVSLEPSWHVTSLRAVVWLQRDSDRSVLAATLASDAGSIQPLPVSGADLSRVTLLPARPNPLRSRETSLLFTLPEAAPARVRVLDLRGRVVRVLTDGPRPDGVHRVRWDGTDDHGRWMAPGVYFVQLDTPGTVLARKLTLIH